MDDLPGIEGDADPVPAGRARIERTIGRHDELRCRPRLPVPVLVLHHHQRAGPQVALSLAGRRRAASCASTARRASTRFFITDDNFARNKDWEPIFDRIIELREEDKLNVKLHHPGRHALPQDSRTSSRNARAPASSACSSGWRTSTPTICSARRSGRTRSPNIARCCWRGRTRASSPMPATSSASRTTRSKSIIRDIDIIKQRAAGRPAGVLLSDAAAGLGGSSQARPRRRAARPGSEQIRSKPHLHDASENVARGVGSRSTSWLGSAITRETHAETVMRRVEGQRSSGEEAHNRAPTARPAERGTIEPTSSKRIAGLSKVRGTGSCRAAATGSSATRARLWRDGSLVRGTRFREASRLRGRLAIGPAPGREGAATSLRISPAPAAPSPAPDAGGRTSCRRCRPCRRRAAPQRRRRSPWPFRSAPGLGVNTSLITGTCAG